MSAITGALRRRRDGRGLGRTVYGGVFAIVLLLIVPPLVYLVYGALRSAPPGGGGKFTLHSLGTAFASSSVLTPLLNTLALAAVVTVCSVLIGAALAWLVTQTDLAGRRAWELLLATPFYISPLFLTIGVIALAGHPGYLDPVFKAVGMGEGPNIYTFGATAAVMAVNLASYAFLYLLAPMKSLNPELEEAALMLGAKRKRAVLAIGGRLMLPSMLACGVMIFALTAETFSVPQLLWGAQKQTLAVNIFQDITYQPTHLNEAAARGILLLIITFIGVFAYTRLSRRADRYALTTGRQRGEPRFFLGRARVPVAIILGVYLALVTVLPFLALIFASLQPFINSSLSLHQLSFANYSMAFASSNSNAFKNSAILVVTGTLALLLLSYVINYWVQFTRVRGRVALQVLSNVTMAVPGLALGVGMLWAYIRLPGGLWGSIWLLLIAYVTRWLAQAVGLIRAGFLPLSISLDEAGQVLGASAPRRLRTLLLPLTRRAAISAALIVTLLILGEVPVTLLLYSPNSQTISVVIWNALTIQGPSQAAVFAVILGVVSFFLMGALFVVSYRQPRAERAAGTVDHAVTDIEPVPVNA
jgi:iron(III) transport system permease protein